MTKLYPATIDEFQDRFNSFNDGVVRTVEIDYASDGERRVAVEIATRDRREANNDGWVCVRLVVSHVEDYCFADASRFCAAVLSHGVHIQWFDQVVGLDFGHFVDPPENLAELKTSAFFATGAAVDWTVVAH